jgi:competence protein ComEC
MRLIMICLAWVAGIYLGSYLDWPWLALTLALIPLLLLIFFKAYRRPLFIFAVILVAFSTGMARYPFSTSQDDPPAWLQSDQTVTLQGRICRQPEIKDRSAQLVLDLQTIDSQPASGRVAVFTSAFSDYHYGDMVQVRGRLSVPAKLDNFDYQAYLARQGITATLFTPELRVIQPQSGFSPAAAIYTLRQKMNDSLAATLPEPQAGLAQGIVLGIRSSIAPDLRNQLSMTGTAHLIAISGINLSIIAGMIVALGLRLFGRRYYLYVWFTLAIIWFYTVLAGWQAPVIRSAVMASVFLLAELLGRQKYALAALALSAAIMAGLDPSLLWSLSFQLSFLAMAGLVLITPLLQAPLQRYITDRWGEKSPAERFLMPVLDSLCVSLGSLFAVWPLIALNFGLFSLAGPLATFLIAPALTPIILLCMLTATIGLFSLPLAWVTGAVAWLFLSYMLEMIKLFASLPLIAVQTGGLTINWVRLYYGLLGLGLLVRSQWRSLIARVFFLKTLLSAGARRLTTWPRQYFIIPLLVMACLTTSLAVTLPEARLQVDFLAVGEGDATLVRAGNRTILIDGGPSPQALLRELGYQLPFWDHHLDLVILTHPHSDHLTGLLEVLQRYRVNQVLAPDLISQNPLFLAWQSTLEKKSVKLNYAVRGQQIKISRDVRLLVLNPPAGLTAAERSDLENQGIVLKIVQGNHSFLLTADIGSEAEQSLIKQRLDLSTTVLKVAHHGSAGSTSTAFLNAAQPQFAVISCGADNNFGHPAPEVLERLDGQAAYRTDLDGTIEFTSDGDRLWVKTVRR